METLLTTAQAGKLLGVTASRVRQLILAGLLPATSVEETRGPVLKIRKSDLKLVKDRPGRGRPKNP